MSLIQEQKKKKEKQQQQILKQQKELKDIFAQVCTMAEGILALRHLMDVCGYQKISIVGNPVTGDINDRSTLYNEAQRNIYLGLRKLIPYKFLKQIEFPSIKK